MIAKPCRVLIKFGEWAVLRECKSIREGRRTLRWERERCSWPLKLEVT